MPSIDLRFGSTAISSMVRLSPSAPSEHWFPSICSFKQCGRTEREEVNHTKRTGKAHAREPILMGG